MEFGLENLLDVNDYALDFIASFKRKMTVKVFLGSKLNLESSHLDEYEIIEFNRIDRNTIEICHVFIGQPKKTINYLLYLSNNKVIRFIKSFAGYHNQKEIGFDESGRIISEQWKKPEHDVIRKEFVRNKNGLLVSEDELNESGEMLSQAQHFYRNGQLISTINLSPVNCIEEVIIYHYNIDGALVKEIIPSKDENSYCRLFEYDSNGYLIKETLEGEEFDRVYNYSYGKTESGDLITEIILRTDNWIKKKAVVKGRKVKDLDKLILLEYKKDYYEKPIQLDEPDKKQEAIIWWRELDVNWKTIFNELIDNCQEKKKVSEHGYFEYLCTSRPQITELEKILNLESVIIYDNPGKCHINSFICLDNLTLLSRLEIIGLGHVRAEFGKQTSLRLTSLKLQSFIWDSEYCLRSFKNLRSLDIESVYVEDYSFLEDLKNLERLSLIYQDFKDLSVLSFNKKLKILSLIHCAEIDLTTLPFLDELRSLHLTRGIIKDFSPLTTFTNLECLSLERTDLENLDFVRGMKSLKELYVGENEITNLEPLYDLNSLEKIDLIDNPIGKVQIHELKKHLPNCEILFDEPDVPGLNLSKSSDQNEINTTGSIATHQAELDELKKEIKKNRAIEPDTRDLLYPSDLSDFNDDFE